MRIVAGLFLLAALVTLFLDYGKVTNILTIVGALLGIFANWRDKSKD